MREVTLFIAMSLDGYIADENCGVDWLNAEAPEDPGEDLYEAFIQNIDTILMGWKTYHQIVTELSPQEWPYPDQQTYVFTHREMPSSEKTAFIREDPASFVKKLKETEGKGIWICGGASLAGRLLNEDLVDCLDLTILPVLLGNGISLFQNEIRRIALQLETAQKLRGMVHLVYRRSGFQDA